MSGGNGAVFPLDGNQLTAAEPEENVWLSASAGTGKTQVLSARVLRLLLREDVSPSQILCLTFTKAGAAEMANRINAVLARWVRLDAGTLGKELRYLGADISPATQERARSLFASVLDCPGGGLRIDTIHAFAQYLIGNFPEEAGLAPGMQVLDDRSRELLARDVLTDMFEEAEATHDVRVLDGIEHFVTRKDPGALHKWLMRAASAQELWEGPGSWQSPMGDRVRQTLGMPADADESWVSEPLDPDRFPDGELMAVLAALREWGKPSGEKAIAGIERWIGLEYQQRAGALDCLVGGVLNGDLLPNGNLRHAAKFDPDFVSHQQTISDSLTQYQDRRALLACAEIVTSALEIGRAFAVRWEARKAREGWLDFPDLIRKAAALLGQSDAADWIRYKLDRHFDHILIDEAQDTNQSQWDIVEALIDDFFTGEGARGDKLRTIFTVGDYKQAIFGFQGTSPENFARAKQRIHARIEAARQGIRASRTDRREPGWQDLDLGRSFRTADIVLGFVNRMIELLGFGEFGLDREPPPHEGAERPGLVTLWPPVFVAAGTGEGGDDEDEESGRDWLPRNDTLLAGKIADQVQRWLTDEPFVLAKGTRRHAQAGDIMVLVRQRKELAAQIVAKLHARGVPVAGVDRLRLGAPLAVKDVLAALRFSAQPLDDLSLAGLLASPLVGWTQEDILAHVPRPEKMRLWDHLKRADAPPLVAATAERLKDLLRRADYHTPQALITWLLTGPWEGRARLVARLGSEANDPLDELLNAAFAYEAEHWPSLAGFLTWFDAGTGDLKRDSDAASGQVRVMTVHGSKGLQAPIVILADATGAPGEPGDLALEDDPFGLAPERRREVPLPPLGKGEKAGRVTEAEEAAIRAAMQEHWRLLYVALTRAEEALFIGGALNKNEAKKGEPHEESWYARLAPLFEGEQLADPVWGWRKEWGHRAGPLVPDDTAQGSAAAPLELPRWMTTPIGPEPRPPRPLAPSSAGEEAGAEPPLAPQAARHAARRGSLIHTLLERLPEVPASQREQAARAWLERQAGDLDAALREEMLGAALGVLDNPGFAAIFSDAALAEVPLAATVEGVVVAGTADRLLIEDTRITVVDFKTTRRPPASVAEVPLATLRQMAAYVAALEAIYPGREVRAGVLYTHAPVLFSLDSAALAAHKHALQGAQQSLPLPDIE